MRFACCAVLAVLPFCLHAAVVVSGSQHENNYVDSPRAGRSDESAGSGNWAMITRVGEDCIKQTDTALCLAAKTVTALERASRINGNIQVFPGLTLAKNADGGASQRDSRALPTEEEIRNQLQEPVTNGGSKVTDMVVNSALRFLQSRTVMFQFPQTDSEEISRAIEEGRGKLKKKVMPILALLAVKIAAVLPFALGIIGFFALKALVLGKLALLIAGVMAFQKYAASSAGGFGKITDSWSTANVASPWSAPQAAPSTNGGYYRRSMEAAQQMAYNGQAQPSVQTVA